MDSEFLRKKFDDLYYESCLEDEPLNIAEKLEDFIPPILKKKTITDSEELPTFIEVERDKSYDINTRMFYKYKKILKKVETSYKDKMTPHDLNISKLFLLGNIFSRKKITFHFLIKENALDKKTTKHYLDELLTKNIIEISEEKKKKFYQLTEEGICLYKKTYEAISQLDMEILSAL